MKTFKKSSVGGFLVVITLASFLSFLPLPSRAGPVGQLVGELIVKIFKNSDDAISNTRNTTHAASPQLARKSVDEDTSNTVDSDWEDCILTAKKKNAEERLFALEELRLKSQEVESLHEAAKTLDTELATQFCVEIIQCNVTFFPQYSTMVDDFGYCIAEEIGSD